MPINIIKLKCKTSIKSGVLRDSTAALSNVNLFDTTSSRLRGFYFTVGQANNSVFLFLLNACNDSFTKTNRS